MRFDLVLATVGRTEELRSFIESLAQQTYRDFRLFVVDQNDDDRVPALFASLELGFERRSFARREGSRGHGTQLCQSFRATW